MRNRFPQIAFGVALSGMLHAQEVGGQNSNDMSADLQMQPLDRMLVEAADHAMNRRYHKASLRFHQIKQMTVRSGVRAEATLHLGQCLEAIGLISLPISFVLESIQTTVSSSPSYLLAIQTGVHLAELSGVFLPFQELLADDRPSSLDAQVPFVAYARGASSLGSGNFSQAIIQLEPVAKADDFASILALHGLILALERTSRVEETRVAWEMFSNRLTDSEPISRARPDEEMAYLREMARFGQASFEAKHQAGQNSRLLLEAVSSGSSFFGAASVSLARQDLQEGLGDAAIERLERLRSRDVSAKPVFGAVPEAAILLAQIYRQKGFSDRSNQILHEFLTELKELEEARDEAQTLLEKGASRDAFVMHIMSLFRGSPDNVAAAPGRMDGMLGPEVDRDVQQIQELVSVLMPYLRNDLLQNREFREVIRMLSLLSGERQTWLKQPDWWQQAMGSDYLERMRMQQTIAMKRAEQILVQSLTGVRLKALEWRILAIAEQRAILRN